MARLFLSSRGRARFWDLCLITGLLGACSPDSPQVGSQTNWYRLCSEDSECGELVCLCSTCTLACEAGDACGDEPGAACAASTDPGTVALCGGQASEAANLCVRTCDDVACPEGSSCQAGVCVPSLAPTALATLDLETRYQALVGFGATVGSAEELELAAHPAKDAVFDAMFLDSGVDVVRFNNRFFAVGDEDLGVTAALLDAAEQRLGRRPLVLLTSESPPDGLKANGSRQCAGDPATCTLSRDGNGGFDYAGFALHWRDLLEAYQSAGVDVDYISVQDNPDIVPPPDVPADACRFLPVEGVQNVPMPGGAMDVEYPGLEQAISAVRAELDGFSSTLKILAPEASGVTTTRDFASGMDLAEVDALAHHMYGTEAGDIDPAALPALYDVAEAASVPLFQTEMRADGVDTAVLLHESLVNGAAVYLQNDFVASAEAGGDPMALVSLEADGFALELPYHVIRHFARSTEPGWVRVAVDCSPSELLCSAWLSPGEDALTLVVVNLGEGESVVQLELDPARDGLYAGSTITRTVFSGVERSAELGELSADRSVLVPPQSLVTIALSE